jgi:hypothetical protein
MMRAMLYSRQKSLDIGGCVHGQDIASEVVSGSM